MLGVPCYNYSNIYPRNLILIIKAPTLSVQNRGRPFPTLSDPSAKTAKLPWAGGGQCDPQQVGASPLAGALSMAKTCFYMGDDAAADTDNDGEDDDEEEEHYYDHAMIGILMVKMLLRLPLLLLLLLTMLMLVVMSATCHGDDDDHDENEEKSAVAATVPTARQVFVLLGSGPKARTPDVQVA